MKDPAFDLYQKMYRIRRSEEAIIRHYGEDEMKSPMHMSMGQEAISVAVCHALEEKDQVFSTYRSHAAFLAKTQDTDRFFAELYGKVTGTAGGKAGSMHLSAPHRGHLCSSAIVGSCIPVAVGAAFAHKVQKTGLVSCVFFGDGALDEGVFWESLNVACVKRLPVVFVCEDNGLAVHTPVRQRQGYGNIDDVVARFECDVAGEDTTDVRTIYQTARLSVERTRETARPAFLRFSCYRYLEHVGIAEDFDAGYRPRADFVEWQKKDSILLERRRLLSEGVTEERLRKAENDLDREIDTSLSRARESLFPAPEDLYKGVFHEKD
jgi:TPP-dependent pyruvate/acetoin dehydrogenase alpha subunit